MAISRIVSSTRWAAASSTIRCFGTQTSPRAGISYYALRPRKGIFSGTRVLFNFGDAVREPTLTDQFDSLYSFLLVSNGGQSATIQQLHIKPLVRA